MAKTAKNKTQTPPSGASLPDDLKDILKEVLGKKTPEDVPNDSSIKNGSLMAHYSTRLFIQKALNALEEKMGGNENAWIYGKDIQNDLKKIRFGKSFVDCGWTDMTHPGLETGFDDLKDGLTVIWAAACGMAECPVAFCLYVDNHKHVRAFIPEDGNMIDLKNNCAMVAGSPVVYDMEKLRKAVIDQIQVDPKTKPKKKISKKKKPTPVHKKP